MTATAFRADGESLGDVFEEVVAEASILDMIRSGYLVDVRAKRVTLEADFGFHVRAGDYALGEVEETLLRANAPAHAAAAYLEHAGGRKALVFTPTVAVAHAMADAFRAAGVAAEAVDGSTPPDERRAILRRLRSGATMVVPNCAVLTEGFDEPSVSCVIVARPTRSKGLYCQMAGRGTRIHPGKSDLLILDLVGATSRHDLVTAARLFGVPDARLERGRSVVEALADEEHERKVRPADGRRVSVDVDPFAGARLAWAAAGAGRWALSLGDRGTLLLVPDGAERWSVVLAARDGSAAILAAGLTLPYAQGLAEDEARRSKALVLSRRDARWRREAATARQEEVLQRWRQWRPGMTRGEAADLISARVAKRAAAKVAARATGEPREARS